jgi:hypothetical protein
LGNLRQRLVLGISMATLYRKIEAKKQRRKFSRA